MGLEDSVKATWEQLQVLRGNAHCAQAGAQKTCVQLAELEETLQSSEEKLLRAASALSFLVPWSPNPASHGAAVGVFAPALPLTDCLWCGALFMGCLMSPANWFTLGLLLTEKVTVCKERICVEQTEDIQWWAGSLRFPYPGTLLTECWCHG